MFFNSLIMFHRGHTRGPAMHVLLEIHATQHVIIGKHTPGFVNESVLKYCNSISFSKYKCSLKARPHPLSCNKDWNAWFPIPQGLNSQQTHSRVSVFVFLLRLKQSLWQKWEYFPCKTKWELSMWTALGGACGERGGRNKQSMKWNVKTNKNIVNWSL